MHGESFYPWFPSASIEGVFGPCQITSNQNAKILLLCCYCEGFVFVGVGEFGGSLFPGNSLRLAFSLIKYTLLSFGRQISNDRCRLIPFRHPPVMWRADVKTPGYQVANLGYCITSLNTSPEEIDNSPRLSRSLWIEAPSMWESTHLNNFVSSTKEATFALFTTSGRSLTWRRKNIGPRIELEELQTLQVFRRCSPRTVTRCFLFNIRRRTNRE